MDIEFCIGGSADNFSGFQAIALYGNYDDNDIKKLDSWILTEEPSYRIKHTADFISYAVRDTRFLAPNGSRANRVTVEIRIARKAKLSNQSPLDLLNEIYNKFKSDYAVAIGEGINLRYKLKPEAANYDVITADFCKLVGNYSCDHPSDAGYVEMQGSATGFLCIETEDQLRDFFYDSQYPEFSNYSQIEIGKDCRSKVSADLIRIPEKIDVVVMVNGDKVATLTSLSKTCIISAKSTELEDYDTVRFTLGELRAKGGSISKTNSYSIVWDKDDGIVRCTLHGKPKNFKMKVEFQGDDAGVDRVIKSRQKLTLMIGSSERKTFYITGNPSSLNELLPANKIFDMNKKTLKQPIIIEGVKDWELKYDHESIDEDRITLYVDVQPKKASSKSEKPVSDFGSGVVRNKPTKYEKEDYGNVTVIEGSYFDNGNVDSDYERETANNKGVDEPTNGFKAWLADNRQKIALAAIALLVVAIACVIFYNQGDPTSAELRTKLCDAAIKGDAAQIAQAYNALSDNDKQAVKDYCVVADNISSETKKEIEDYKSKHKDEIKGDGAWAALCKQSQTIHQMTIPSETPSGGQTADDQKTGDQQTGGDQQNENQQTGGKQNGGKKVEDPKTVLAYLQKQEFDKAMQLTNDATDKLAIAVLKKNVGKFSKDFYSQRISKWKDWAVEIAQKYLLTDINAKIAVVGYEGVLSDNPGAVYSNIVGRFKEELALLDAKGLKATAHLRKMFPKDKPKRRNLEVYIKKLADDKKVTWDEFLNF